MNTEKHRQYLIIDGYRPTEEQPLSEMGILQKLTSLQTSTGLYTAVKGKRCPYSERERLKEKYKGQYKIKNGLLGWLDGVDRVLENIELRKSTPKYIYKSVE